MVLPSSTKICEGKMGDLNYKVLLSNLDGSAVSSRAGLQFDLGLEGY